jgi:hypothetical protein
LVADARPAERLPTGLIGAAGEYYVAAELSLQGWLATVTIKKAPTTDVLAQHLATGWVVAIQTKTASPGNKFMLGPKDEIPSTAANEWYVFVGLAASGARPTFFVVPRNVVAGMIYARNRHRLATPSQSGAPHKPGSTRMVHKKLVEPYRERWDFLQLPTAEVPLLVDDDVLAVAKEYGLPDAHPGWPPR